MKRISLKLANMRQPQDFIVCPRPTNVGAEYELITLQSSTRILRLSTTTNKGLISVARPGGAYNIDLLPKPTNPKRNPIAVEVSPDIIRQAMELQPKPGDSIGGGVIIG